MKVRGWLRRQLASDVVIHTTDDITVRGFLEEVGRDGVILRAARYLEGQGAIPLGGELFIPREKVRMVQVRPSADE